MFQQIWDLRRTCSLANHWWNIPSAGCPGPPSILRSRCYRASGMRRWILKESPPVVGLKGRGDLYVFHEFGIPQCCGPARRNTTAPMSM